MVHVDKLTASQPGAPEAIDTLDRQLTKRSAIATRTLAGRAKRYNAVTAGPCSKRVARLAIGTIKSGRFMLDLQ